MGAGLNKVMLIGYVGREPEMRYTPGGRPVTSFSVATHRIWTTPDGQERQETDWFNVVSWGNLAEICKQQLYKNQRIYVEGRLQTRNWEDRQGKRHFRAEIVANEMIALDSQHPAGPPAAEEDEILFWSDAMTDTLDDPVA
ncbi:MAG: single-stranded DNA-binding protein [Chloroflexota bacterium]